MSTLIRPPPNDPAISSMENTLELTQLTDIDPNVFTNTRPLWHPPGARGVYGGAVIAQCLSAAQRTVDAQFSIHSMHCYFVLAGNSEIPIIYYVERVRDGRSFATRTVQARQRGRPIFTVTLSFMRALDERERIVRHAVGMPDVPGPEEDEEDFRRAQGPFESHHMASLNDESKNAHTKRTRMWIRSRGRISKQGGHEAHLSALAYMSDSFFIGTVARAHNLWRNMLPRTPPSMPKAQSSSGNDENETAQAHFDDMKKQIRHMNGGQDVNSDNKPEIGMMVSLDHTIYFHRPRDFRADEWMLSEMNTPWSGDGRGVVQQHIWSKDGKLIATCFQEGLVRLKQPSTTKL